MYTVLLVIHSILVLFLIGLILMQRSDSDGLSGLGGGGGNLLSGRAAGNMLTRVTAILATLFILSSLALTIIGAQRTKSSIVDGIEETPAAVMQEAPAPEKKVEKPAAAPSVPKPE